MPPIREEKIPERASPQRSTNGNVGTPPTRKPGSILSQVIPVARLADDYIKMCIYGQNRVGKTTLACQFPKPLLLVSFEPSKSGGAKSVKRVAGVEYVHLEKPATAATLAEELKVDTFFKTHVIDTATSLQDIILQELLGLTTIPDQLAWGTVSDEQYRQRSEKAREILRKFLNLNAHTVILAKEKDHNPPKGERQSKLSRGLRIESYYAADIGTATAGWLHDCCDYICRLYIDKEVRIARTQVEMGGEVISSEEEEETGRYIRKLLTSYHPNFAGGFRSEVPKSVPDVIVDPTWEKIKAVMEGKPIQEK